MMNKNGKALLIAAIALMVIGAAIFAVAMTANRWDFGALGTEKLETTEVTVEGDFTEILVDSETADIKLALSADGSCKVLFELPEGFSHTAEAKDGKLNILCKDEREKDFRFFRFGFSSPRVTVCLPGAAYDSLVIGCTTGDIEVPSGFAFGSAQITLTTGGTDFRACCSGDLAVKATTGDIFLTDVTANAVTLDVTTGDCDLSRVKCESFRSEGTTGELFLRDTTVSGDMALLRTSGDLLIEDSTCKNLTASVCTGGITLKDTTAAENFSLEATTGYICFDGADAAQISAKTTTGDVTGTLKSDKIFVASTSTGDVSVPKTTTGGICEITTTTGGISIKIR